MIRMKKRVLVLAVIFCIFLVLGCIHNLQEGVYIGSDFWVKQSDGRYTCYDDSIRVEKAEDGVQFVLTTDGKNWTAELMKQETGWLLTTDQGWSVRVEATGLPSIGVEANGRYISLDEGKTLLIDDVDAMGLVFEGLGEEIRTPFYDESGREMGMLVEIMTMSGKVISVHEQWHDRPEMNVSAPETIVLRNGTQLTGSDVQSVYINERGEYLINSERLLYEQAGSLHVDKRTLARELIRMAEEEPASRGSMMAVVLYVVLYAVGAAGFLWPEKVAFLGTRWRFRHEPELSEAGLFAELLGAAVVLGCAVIMLFAPIH